MAAKRVLKASDPKSAKPSKPKILIFGKPGVGKTWASLDFPSVYYIDCEAGANLSHYTDKLKASGGMYLGPADGANDLQTVAEEIITLATTQHSFRTLVIDSFSKLFNSSISREYQRMQEGGRDMEKTFGAEKKAPLNIVRRIISWLEKLDMTVILVCHQKDVWADNKMVGVTFDGWDKLEHELHLCLNIVQQGPARVARITKTRFKEFELGTGFSWSYAEFSKRFGRDVIEAPAAPFVPAPAERVAQLAALIDVLKVDAETTDKWKDKAGVESFDEMDADTVSKCISHLTEKLPKAA